MVRERGKSIVWYLLLSGFRTCRLPGSSHIFAIVLILVLLVLVLGTLLLGLVFAGFATSSAMLWTRFLHLININRSSGCSGLSCGTGWSCGTHIGEIGHDCGLCSRCSGFPATSISKGEAVEGSCDRYSGVIGCKCSNRGGAARKTGLRVSTGSLFRGYPSR